MKNFRKILDTPRLLLSSLLVGSTLLGSSVSAAPKTCKDIKMSILECNTNHGDPILGLLLQVINFLAVGVGIAVVGGIIWGGMLYASSNGDASKVQQGKMAIVNALIGLFLFIFMYAIINYLVPGGLFR